MKVTRLAKDEMETCLSMTGDNHEWWIVYSDDPFWIKKLDKIGVGVARGWGKEYTLRADQVRFRAGKREMSDAQRVQAHENLARVNSDRSIG